MAEITVGYFLEDIGQERFLIALVERVAKEKGVPPTGCTMISATLQAVRERP